MTIAIMVLRRLPLIGLILLACLTLPPPVAQAAIITVTTTADEINKNGDCSLREAVRAANLDKAVDACLAGNGADIIKLPPGTYILAIAGTGEDEALTGDLDLTTKLAISGAGRTKTIIDGNNLDQVFDIAANITVEISGVTVTGGKSTTTDRGGGLAIDEKGTLTLINSTVSGNNAVSGGGLYVDEGSRVTLTNSWVDDNEAFEGGGIYVNKNARLTVINSQVTKNTSDGGGGGIFTNEGSMVTITNSQMSGNMIIGSDGGAIYMGYSSLTLTNSQVTGNSTINWGGGIYVDHSTLTLTNSQVTGNTAGIDGGGIFGDNGLLTLTNSQVSGNSASGGGGIYVDDESTLIFTNGQISSNTSLNFEGGGIFSEGAGTLVNSTISGNSALTDGGGLYIDGGTFNLHNVTITNNTADSDGNDSGQGGGVYIFSPGATLTMTNSIIAGNLDLSSAGNQHPDCSGQLIGGGYNLIEDTTGCFAGGDLTGNLTGLSPNLGPLQDNGGASLTHALLAGSPAIDAGNPAGCLDPLGLTLTTDQRGFVRPVDGGSGSARCDMGAYEFNPSPPPALSFSPGSTLTAEEVVTATAPVYLSEASSDAVQVDYSVTGGTASGGGVDYNLPNGSLLFAPGVVSQTIEITLVDDTEPETDETVVIGLSNPQNAVLGAPAVFTLTIPANDGGVGAVAVYLPLVVR